MLQILAYIGYIVLALLILLLMITIHEFGHYIAGKIFKFKINEFSIGFGPKLFSKKKKNGEIFSIRAIPLGGYCAFAGEDDITEPAISKDDVFKDEERDGQAQDNKKSGVIKLAGSLTGTAKGEKISKNSHLKMFNEQPPYKRIIVLAAGGIFNILSAVIFCFLFIAIVGLPQPKVAALTQDEFGVNYITQLEVGDVITHINGKSTSLNYLFSGTLDNSGEAEKDIGTQLKLTVRKADGRVESITLEKQRIVRWTLVYDLDKPILNKDGTQSKDSEGNLLYEYKKDAAGNYIYEIALDENGDPIKDDVKYGLATDTHLNKGIKQAFINCVPLTGKMSWFVLKTLGQLLTGKLSCTNVTGPVGTVTSIASTTRDYGYRNLLLMMPLIAANLGVFNLLPIPALDGSKIIFGIIEWIRKKPLNRKVEGMIHAIGLIVLFGLVIILDISGMFMRCIG